MNDKAPQPTDLYRLYDNQGTLLYIGISNSWQSRMAEHATTKEWWPEVSRSQIAHFPCRCLAAHAERNAIQTEAPRFNVVHNRQLPPPPPSSTSGRATLGALRASDGPRPPFNRDVLTLVWADEILPKLKPFTKALYQAGRFVGTAGYEAKFALPTEPHRQKCEDSRAEVESVLRARFGRSITIRLTIDHGETT